MTPAHHRLWKHMCATCEHLSAELKADVGILAASYECECRERTA